MRAIFISFVIRPFGDLHHRPCCDEKNLGSLDDRSMMRRGLPCGGRFCRSLPFTVLTTSPVNTGGGAMRILLIEDEAELGELVAANLRRSGFAIDLAGTLEEAEAALATARYDILLLDLRLPDGDGFQLIRGLRRRRDTTPIIALTARDRLADRVEGLNLGADDYLVKPFAHEELLARVQAVLRRPRQAQAPELSLANLTVALETADVAVDARRVEVPRLELAILRLLMRRAGRVVSRESLENGIYDDRREIESNALDAAISRLRKRLGAAGAAVEVQGLRGAGYLMRARTT
jgi:DNA-binding response OmpR family regulator